MLRIVFLIIFIVGMTHTVSCQKYFMKTFELNNGNEYGEGSGSSVLSKDEQFLIFNSVDDSLNINQNIQSRIKIHKYEFSTGLIKTIDTISKSNKSIQISAAWRGGLAAISDTSYVIAYLVIDTFKKSRLDFKYYTELYCFTDKGDSLWTQTFTGTDSLTYLDELHYYNNRVYFNFVNYFKRNSLNSIGSIIELNDKGQLEKVKTSNETLKGGINGYFRLFFQSNQIVGNFAFYPTIGPSNEGQILQWDTSFNLINSVELLSSNFSSRYIKLLKLDNTGFVYFAFWDTAYPYNPKLKDALHYVYYVAKLDKTGKLLGRYFLEDGVKQNFFNAVHAVKKKNGDYLLLLNEDSKLPENDYGNVNIGLYCMSPSGAIKWKRKYYTHRRSQNDTYSSDLILNANDDIFITGYANNMYDTTDIEWDILLIAADSNGCIPGMDCENFYTASTKDISSQQPIPFVIYPNPNNGRFAILQSEPATQGTEVYITNMMGKTILHEKIPFGILDYWITMPPSSKGIYLLQVYNGSHQLIGQKKIDIE